jgi:hypothetical protein
MICIGKQEVGNIDMFGGRGVLQQSRKLVQTEFFAKERIFRNVAPSLFSQNGSTSPTRGHCDVRSYHDTSSMTEMSWSFQSKEVV